MKKVFTLSFILTFFILSAIQAQDRWSTLKIHLWTTFPTGDPTVNNKGIGNLNSWTEKATSSGTGNWLYFELGWAAKWGGSASLNSVGTMAYNGSDGTVSATNNYYYTFNFPNNPPAGSASYAVLETSAQPVTFSSLSQSPQSGSVSNNEPVTVSITLSNSPCSQEHVFVRYTTDDWNTSNFSSEASYNGSTATCTIPKQGQGTTVKYYAFSTTVTSGLSGTNCDYLTLHYLNSSGSNYQYTVDYYGTSATGDWNQTATWETGVLPPVGAKVKAIHNLTINDAVSNSINTLLIPSTKNVTFGSGGSLTISSAVTNNGTLDMTSGGTLTFSNNAGFANNATFTYGSGTVVYSGAGTASGTVGFNLVTIAGGVNFGSSSTIYGTLRINTGGYVNTNPPTYASGSVLQYNTSGTYGRATEWSATAGAGYPFHINITNNTLLNLGNNGTGIARKCAGNLLIENGSTLSMNETGSEMTASLTIVGNLTNNGTLTLSGKLWGDLNIEGNWVTTGTFNHNTRAVTFNGSAAQEIQSGATTFGYLTVDNAAGLSVNGSGLVTVANNLDVNSGKLLTVKTGKSITVTGTLTTHEATALVLESNASLIATTSQAATVKREIASDSKWHFLSSPVAAQAICNGDFAPTTGNFNQTYGETYDFYKWSEATVTGGLNWINLKNTGWTLNTSFGDTPAFGVGMGYLVEYGATFSGSTTKSFAGNLNVGDQTITLTSTGTTWNLIGNPFSSAINWDGVDKTYIQGYYCVYNEAKAGGAGYEYYMDISHKTDGANGKISAMQGFFVKASGSSITLPQSARVHDNNWMKNADVEPVNKLTIKLADAKNYDQAYVIFEEQGSATTGGPDAEKLFSMENIVQVMTIKTNRNICINSMPLLREAATIPVGLFIPANGTFTLSVSGLESFNPQPGIVLEDLKTHATQNLAEKPAYQFTATTTDDPNRFLLHLAGTNGIGDTQPQGAFRFYNSGNSLVVVDLQGNRQGDIYVYNLVGQLLAREPLSASGSTQLRISDQTGYYLVKVVTPGGTWSGKVFIK